MASSLSTRERKDKISNEITKDKTASDEYVAINDEKARGSTTLKYTIHKTKPKKVKRQPARTGGAQTEKKERQILSKEKVTILEDKTEQNENTMTQAETTPTGCVQCTTGHSTSTCHEQDPHRAMPEGHWLQQLIAKYSQKEYSSNRKNKHKTSSTSSKGKHGKSTWSMRKHHHATFAHLIHDAFIRLKCNPNYSHGGFSKRAVAKNIEKHYRVKLGAKFKARLNLSFENLVAKRKLITHGRQRWGIKYTPTQAFLKQFERLKVIDGAANSTHGERIHHGSRSQSLNSSRSRSQSRSRSSSRGSSRSSTRISRSEGRRRRHQSHHICGSPHWRCEHIPHDPKFQQFDKSSNMEDEYSSKASSSAASEHGNDAGMGGSLFSMFWPKKKSEDGEKGLIPEPSTPSIEPLENQKWSREDDIPDTTAPYEDIKSHKRKREGNRGPREVGIQRFKKRIKGTSRSLSPEHSPRASYASSSSESLSRELDSDPIIHSQWKTIDEGKVGSQQEELFVGFATSTSSSEQGNDYRDNYDETIHKKEHSSGSHRSSRGKGSRQKKEHDLLHDMKSSSQMASQGRRGWFARLGDALSFRSDHSEIGSGSERMSTSLSNQVGPSACQRHTEIGPDSLKQRVKKVMSKRHAKISWPDVRTIDKDGSRSPRHPKVFCSPQLAILLQE